MGNINEQHLIDEIRFDIEKRDLIKARLVLASLEQVSRKAQKQALLEVSRADDEFSIPLLASVVAENNGVSDSFPQIREIMFSRILDRPDVLLDLLSKKDAPVRKAFLAEVAGKIRLDKAVPVLKDILDNEKDDKTIESVIIALGMIGESSPLVTVSKHLYSSNKDIVNASIKTLGQIATKEAVQKLTERLGKDPDLDFMVIDTIAKIQIPEAIEALNRLLGSQFAHIRSGAKQKLGEIGVMSIRVLIKNLERDDADLIIHSLNVLGDLGDGSAIPAIRKLLFNEPKDANIRFAAYETLGRLPLDKGAVTLASGLEDPDDNVRDAAAKAIDNNYNPVLAGGGVRNMTGGGDAQSLSIIKTIINSQCDNIFMDLLEEDYFQGPAIKYIAGNAHSDIKSHFSGVLSRGGYEELAKKLKIDRTEKGKGRLKVFAVDDSKMILTIYRTVLHNLGYESKLFEFPAEALEQIRQERPDVILTDLNMPEITGIELTRRVRKIHSKEELPIIMVTTQDEAKDNKTAYDAGINDFLRKPFTETQIGKVLEKIK